MNEKDISKFLDAVESGSIVHASAKTAGQMESEGLPFDVKKCQYLFDGTLIAFDHTAFTIAAITKAEGEGWN